MSIPNPFFYGNPVPPNQLIGREKELRRIMGRIVNQGQSTAITGLPRSGKTSVLEYLKSPSIPDFYGDWANRLIFSHIDAIALGGQYDHAQFWTQALKPLENYTGQAPLLAETYQICQQNKFGTFVLERLIAQVRQANLRLVLMIDDFDVLLHHPILNNPEFFGSLRSLASRSQGGLALVITGNASLSQLHEDTKHFNPTGSPYFNFMDEITLGPLSEADIDTLLHEGDAYFTEDDRRFIKKLTGGHPYPLQLASSILWEEYEHGDEKDPVKRQQRVEQAFHNKNEATMTDNEPKLEREHRDWYKLFLDVECSVCYHEHRQHFYQHLRTITNAMIVIFGSAAIVALLSNTLGVLVAALVTITATIELIFDSCRMFNKHADLRKRFLSLEQEMTKVVTVNKDDYVSFHNKRLTLQKDEPPVLKVLSARCHNELVRNGKANRLQEREFEIKWYQSLFANFIDIGEDKLRRRN